MRFQYFLARELGYGSVRRMLRDLSSAELAGWLAYYRVQFNAEAVQAGLDVDVESKLRRAFGPEQRERWRRAHGGR